MVDGSLARLCLPGLRDLKRSVALGREGGRSADVEIRR
jgi:hypothetical protein